MNKILTTTEYKSLIEKQQKQDLIIEDLWKEIQELRDILEQTETSKVGQVYVYDKTAGKAIQQLKDDKGE